MYTHTWMDIDAKIQGMIVADFKMAGINFERDFVEDEVKSTLESPWIDREEASAYARVSKDTIDNWLKTGEIVYSKTAEARPGRVLIEKSSLEKYIRNKNVKRKKRNRETFPSVRGGYRVQN